MTPCNQCEKPARKRGMCNGHYQKWRRAGGVVAVKGGDLPRCVVCDARLRPYKAPLSKWPGTKGKVSSRPPLCTTHQNGRSNATVDFKENIVPQIPQEEVRVVRRLIKDRFEGDDYLLITDALGIGSDID